MCAERNTTVRVVRRQTALWIEVNPVGSATARPLSHGQSKPPSQGVAIVRPSYTPFMKHKAAHSWHFEVKPDRDES